MKTTAFFCALAAASAAFGADSAAMDILHRTAETYRQMGKSQLPVTVQTIRGDKVSERADTRACVFDRIDEHVTNARIAREERYMQDGKPVGIVIVQVTRDQWPEGTLAGVQFAMYRIDKQTYHVYKVSTYAKETTEIAFYSGGAPAPSAASGEPATMVAMEAPDFTLNDVSGRPVHLRDLRGKVVVVDFWATWCGPCRALMPHIQKMYDELSAKGLDVLGLDVGENAAKVSKFAQQQSYTFRLLLDAEPDVTSRYFVQAYPTTFVIGRDGRIAFRDLGSASADDLRAAVQKALAGD